MSDKQDVVALMRVSLIETLTPWTEGTELAAVLACLDAVPYTGDDKEYVTVAVEAARVAAEQAVQPRMDALCAETAAVRADTEQREAAFAQWQREFEEFRRMVTPRTIQ